MADHDQIYCQVSNSSEASPLPLTIQTIETTESNPVILRVSRKLSIGTTCHGLVTCLYIPLPFEEAIPESRLFSKRVAGVVRNGVTARRVLEGVPGCTSFHTVGKSEHPNPEKIEARIVGFAVDGEGHLLEG